MSEIQGPIHVKRSDLGDPIVPLSQVRFYSQGIDHPEAVTTGPDGVVYCGGEAGQVYRIEGFGARPKLLGQSPNGITLSLCVDADSRVYKCDPQYFAIHVFEQDGSWKRYTDSFMPKFPIKVPNGASFDAKGNMYVSSTGDYGQSNGCIVRIKPGGEHELWCDALTTSTNGNCLSPGDSHLYVAMTNVPPRISRAEILPDGSAGRVEDVVIFADMYPDGVAFDEAGNLYMFMYRPDCVLLLRKGSRQVQLYAEDPAGIFLSAPAGGCFVMHEGKPLLVIANFGFQHLSCVPVEHPGLPLNHPKIF